MTGAEGAEALPPAAPRIPQTLQEWCDLGYQVAANLIPQLGGGPAAGLAKSGIGRVEIEAKARELESVAARCAVSRVQAEFLRDALGLMAA